MKKIIFDCDNTMGVAGCDVDDGLALLYLLGKKEINILGITTTYGNSDIDTVYSTTYTLLKDLELSEIPLLKGSPDRYTLESPAARFIVDTVNSNNSDISILATGSLTNLYGAYLLDNTIFERISEIVLMGGVTDPLIINGKNHEELNFSCDPSATKCILKNCKNISIVTGNSCLKAFFSKKEFYTKLLYSDKPIAKYILKKTEYWFEEMASEFDMAGFYNWDVVAAAFMAEPSLFTMESYNTVISSKNFEKGFLNIHPTASEISISRHLNFPKIKNTPLFTEEIYKAWLTVNK